mmetsp:Transcript_14182/g.29822  ORF Transcript_14182/g.29822 Transcript_14182/m.29822 type:complete len:638 (-) Transcript_14182:138-2051(-)
MMSSPGDVSCKRSCLRKEIDRIRGGLFIADGGSSNLSRILDLVQELTKAESAIIESQNNEILLLKEQLKEFTDLGNYNDVCKPKADIVELEASKRRIIEEIKHLKHQVRVLVSERTNLVKEVEVYGHMAELASELEEAQTSRHQLEIQLRELHKQMDDVLAERDAAADKAETESLIRDELQNEMRVLYQEKIEHQKRIYDLQAQSSSIPSSVSSIMYEEDIKRLKKEIDIIRAENESLRVTAKREATTRQILNDEIKSLSAQNVMIKRSSSHGEDQNDIAASRKRALALSQGNAGDDERSRELKRSISYEPRDRLGSYTSDNSATHESDNVSVLFGQDSIAGRTAEISISSQENDSKSDHKGIRAHAEKLLFWANKAAERSKTSSSNSVASGSITSRQHSVPATIGLPPRSQSWVVRKSGRLPPRPPQEGIDRAEPCGNIGDKENGSSFSRSKQKHTVIFNIDKVQNEKSCQCSSSPFSGTDPHAEFFLPKLGLACSCGKSSIVKERESFSENPTALKNFLRDWQCDFLLTLNVETADQLLRMHKSSPNDMARKMKQWRVDNNMSNARSKECFVALQIWARTAKVVMRSVKKQRDAGEEVIEKPSFLDISFADTHSVSTLGQLSSVGGKAPSEMVEI